MTYKSQTNGYDRKLIHKSLKVYFGVAWLKCNIYF